MSQKITRRRFLQAGAAVLAVAALTACGGDTPSPAPATTARALGDVTFDVTGMNYTGSHISGASYDKDGNVIESDASGEKYYLVKLSVKNSSAKEAAELKNASFAMKLENGKELTAMASDKYGKDQKELKTFTVAPKGTAEGWVGFGYKVEKDELLQICYLTIEYAKQKVTYKIDGQVVTAGAVTNA